MNAPGTNPAPTGRGWRFWRWALRAAAVLAAVLVAGVALILGELDHPWIKLRVRAVVRSAAGVDLDYAAVRFHPLSGLDVEGLRLLSPTPFRGVAPDLARIGHLQIAWSLSSLVGGGPPIQRAAIEDVAVTIVEGEDGQTSIDALSPTSGALPASPPAKKHRPLRELFRTSLPFRELALSKASLILLRLGEAGLVLDRWTLSGLAARLETRRDGSASLIEVQAGTPAAPLDLLVVREGAAVAYGSARLDLWLRGQASPSGATAAFDLRLREQAISPPVPVSEIVYLQATAAFDEPRTTMEVSVDELRVADKAVTLDGKLSVPDPPGSSFVVREANGAVDLDRLLRAIPPGLVPLVARGTVHWRAQELELGSTPRLLGGGNLAGEAELADVKLNLAHGSVSLRSARWRLQAGGSSTGPTAKTSLELRGLAFAIPGRKATADGIDVLVQGAEASNGAWSGAAHFALESIELPGSAGIAAHRVRTSASVQQLRWDPASPFFATGEVDVASDIATLEARAPSGRASASDLHVRLRVPLARSATAAGQGEVSVRKLRLFDEDGRLLASIPARAELSLANVVLRPDEPALSRATVHGLVRVGQLDANLDATARDGDIDFDFGARAEQLPLPSQLGGAGGESLQEAAPITFSLKAVGHLQGLASQDPDLRQEAELRMQGPALRRLSSRTATLVLRSRGTLSRHHVDLDLTLEPLQEAASWHAVLSADAARFPPALAFQLVTDGGPEASIAGSVELDRGRRLLRCDLDGQLSRLGSLRSLFSRFPVLGGLRLSQLELALAAHLTTPAFASNSDASADLLPVSQLAAGLEGTIRLQGRGLRWQSLDRELSAPSLTLDMDVRKAGSQRQVACTLEADQIELFSGQRKVQAAGLAARASAAFASGLDANVDFALELSLRSLLQDYGAYPVANLVLTMKARHTADGVIRISELRLDNPAAGTSLALQGGLDAGFERRRLSVRGTLQQDLGRVWTDLETFEGRGQLGVTFRVGSSDLAVFRTIADLRLADVHLRLPHAGVAVEAVDGEIPVSADVVVEDHGVTLLRSSDSNPFSQQRFADQHPLLSRSSFLYVGSISSPAATIAPLVGNLKVEQNVFSLDHVEMGYRGGRVSGECALRWDGAASTLRLHARAAGVRSSHGEPFDGNAALLVSAGGHSIDGRIEILRIGSHHLLDLLDLQDPLRADPSTNRIRYALSFGYPDHARVQFDHGFASLRVAFGGLARLFSVDELRGIPTGPLIDRALAPFSKREAP